MGILAEDVLYAQQNPNNLAKKLGKGVTADDVFYHQQAPHKLAKKLGISVNKVFYATTDTKAFIDAVEGTVETEPPENSVNGEETVPETKTRKVTI